MAQTAKLHASMRNPCPHCESPRRCSWLADGLVFCRAESPAAGWRCLGACKADPSFRLYRKGEGESREWKADAPPVPGPTRAEQQQTLWRAYAAGDGAHARPVAGAPGALRRLRQMYPEFGDAVLLELCPVFMQTDGADCPRAGYQGAFAVPERDGEGRVIGHAWVWPSRRKQSRGARGLTIPAGVEMCRERGATLYVVEGASDVYAMRAMGLLAIGRPANTAGAPELVAWLRAEPCRSAWTVVVVGENDRKESGEWPGREGAERVANQVAARVGNVVCWAMPPGESKDVRDWLRAQAPARIEDGGTLGRILEMLLRESFTVVVTAPAAAPFALAPGVAELLSAHAPGGEAEAAEIIAQARADHRDGLRCERPRKVLLAHRATNAPRVQCVRCECYAECPGCAQWRRVREATNAALRCSQAKALYEMAVAPSRWSAVRRALNRAGAEYLRVAESCGDAGAWYVVCDRPHPDAIAVTAEVAAATVRLLLDDYEGQRRPVSTSRGWALPRAEAPAAYRRVGMAPRWLTVAAVRAIAEEAGAAVQASRPKDATGRALRSIDIVREGGFEPAESEWLCSCLQAGEVLPRVVSAPDHPWGDAAAEWQDWLNVLA